MDVRSPSSPTTAERNETNENPKQAACLNCRKSKTRCRRNEGDAKCKKCSQSSAECIIPDYRVGRKKGIKNKRDGLEKAVFRIEQALKKTKSQNSPSGEDENTSHLQNLLSEAQELLPLKKPDHIQPDMSKSNPSLQMDSNVPRQNLSGIPAKASSLQTPPDDHFAVDDAENPLQLLARASDLSSPKNRSLGSRQASTPSSHPYPSIDVMPDEDLQAFFGPLRPSLDVGPEIDPIHLGLVTREEASSLISYFYENLAHTRWGLDPSIHTPDFIGKQSSFLLTSIMAASALFIPAAAAVSKRLSLHCQKLARHVLNSRNRSPEIVLAFMINIPWMAPGKHWSDDETCSFMSAAFTIAVDISLNKLIVPSPSRSLSNVHKGREPSDCITARKALDLDGFHDVDPASDFGHRLLRRRERIWLALYVLDRGVCLARGRSFTVPSTVIIDHCDKWHQSLIAEIWDGSLISTAVLRRDLIKLIADVKTICDTCQHSASRGDSIAQSLQNMIDGFFNAWYSTWAFAIGGTRDTSIPPYVEILVAHGRLSIYSSVINHPSAPIEVKQFFRAAGLSSSLHVMRAAVQGEYRLRSMPNNTAIMISFAACFAFYLSTKGATSDTNLAPSIRRLIEETADVLERVGSNPPHRNGTSSLYGRHLREVIVETTPDVDISKQFLQTQPTYTAPIQTSMPLYQTQSNMAPVDISNLLQFSTMSNDQINEAIINAGDSFGNPLPDLQMHDKTGLDWLDWFNTDVNLNM